MTIEKMSVFNEQSFEKKLTTLKDSQESIQLLSTWCLQHRQHHKKIVTSWHKVLKKVKLDHRLTLFYLANDVIQYSKRRNYEFVESWGTALQRATTMVRDQKVREKILRIFRIWGERGIYDETFISDLCGLMSTQTRRKPVEEPVVEPPVVDDPLDFHPTELFIRIRSCHMLEDETDTRLKQLNEGHKVFTDVDALRSHLKDRRQGEDVVSEVEEGGRMMEAYMTALAAEIKERKRLIEELDLADKFYETQQGDAKLVVNAYRNFGTRVKNLQKHLEERMSAFSSPSPIPSPDINAPSPEPDCDIDLPDTGLSSFLGNNSLPFDFQKNLFSDSSFEGHNDSGEGKPIEVINSRTEAEAEMEFSIDNFLKTLGNLATGRPPPFSTAAAPVNPPPFVAQPAANFTVPPPANPVTFSTPPPPANPPTYSVPPPTTFVTQMPPNQSTFVPPTFPMQLPANQAQFVSQPSYRSQVSAERPNNNSAYMQGEDDEPYEPQYSVGYADLVPLPPPPPPPTWEGDGWDDEETPSSPPASEKHSFSAPRVYDDSQPVHRGDTDARSLRLPMADVDHRPPLSAVDVDHRNLISLTGSPAPVAVDQDYRRAADVDYRVESRDNVESVDMDLSDDDVPPPVSAPPSLLRMPLLAPPPGIRPNMPKPNKMENGIEEAGNINGRPRMPLLHTMPPRLRSPPPQITPPPVMRSPPREEEEHWKDEEVVMFDDWNNVGPPRDCGPISGNGTPVRGGNVPSRGNNGPPRGRGFMPPMQRGPMRGRPMRRPFGGRSGGPRPFRPMYLPPRPGNYGSW